MYRSIPQATRKKNDPIGKVFGGSSRSPLSLAANIRHCNTLMRKAALKAQTDILDWKMNRPDATDIAAARHSNARCGSVVALYTRIAECMKPPTASNKNICCCEQRGAPRAEVRLESTP